MKTENKYIIINSSILFIIASILEMTLHEFGHFFASILVHAHDISLHHNYALNSDQGLPLTSLIFIRAAGPLMSLCIGVIFHFICTKLVKRNVFFLFNVYMSLFGYIGFFGYLMISPIFNYGDTGYIFNALGFPLWTIICIALAAFPILYFITNRLIKYFIEMGTKELIDNEEKRKKFVHSLILFPLFIGILFTTLLNLPIPTFVSLIAPICSPITLMYGYGSALKKKFNTESMNKEFELFNKFNYTLAIILALVIVMNRLLVQGIYINQIQ